MRAMQSRASVGRTARAGALTLLALGAAALTWRLRPSTAIAVGSPDDAIVAGCAWLAWLLAGYLAVAVAASAAAHLVGSAGIAASWLSRVAPRSIRRLVDATVTFSAAAAVLGSSASAQAAPAPVTHVAAGQPAHSVAGSATGSALDWPGLTATVKPPRHSPAPRGDEQPQPVIVVAPGDTLWSIAARHLGPHASGAAITAAWHDWYAANRAVIGPNPSLIHPGQRLSPPTHHATK
jgi:LysM repeat protein